MRDSYHIAAVAAVVLGLAVAAAAQQKAKEPARAQRRSSRPWRTR